MSDFWCSNPLGLHSVRRPSWTHGASDLAIITEGSNDRNYYPADVEQERIALEIEPLWKPDLPINHNPRDIRPQLYGLNTYADLFTARQLTVLSTFCALIGEVRDIIDQDASGVASRSEFGALESGEISYSAALSTYLAFAIDKGTDYWTTIATWMPRGTVGHAFHPAMPMTWIFQKQIHLPISIALARSSELGRASGSRCSTSLFDGYCETSRCYRIRKRIIHTYILN